MPKSEQMGHLPLGWYKTWFIVCALISITSGCITHSAKGKTITVNFNFYGKDLTMPFSQQLADALPDQLTHPDLSYFYSKAEKASELPTITQALQDHSKTLGLDDFGILQLVKHYTAASTDPQNPSQAKILTWFLLYKLGYEVYGGFTEQEFVPYGVFPQEREGGRVEIQGGVKHCLYKDANPNLKKLILFNPKGITVGKKTFYFTGKLPLVPAKPVSRTIQFQTESQQYTVDFTVDANIVAYLREADIFADFSIYARQPFSPLCANSLLPTLRTITQNMRTDEVLDVFLRLTQDGLGYKEDLAQWGKEKYSYPEETLMDTIGDCEDKSLLYAAIVYTLLDIKTVALLYKEHMNLAIQHSVLPNWTGKLVELNYALPRHKARTTRTERFILCEPTGQNFSLGQDSHMDSEPLEGVIPLFE